VSPSDVLLQVEGSPGKSQNSLPLETAVPCGLILNELLSNALKYAFPDGRPGKIHIVFDPQYDGMNSVTFRDNGVGLPSGTDILRVKTLGLHLVRSLVVQQLKGQIVYRFSQGAEFQFTFPAKTKDY
jgi:two-component sensor histidine kinase